MQDYSRNDVVLIRYPFADLSDSKVRPAVIISSPHISDDIFLVPLTSKTISLLPGEFILTDWQSAGLNIVTAVKRGIYTTNKSFVIKAVGRLSLSDSKSLEDSLRKWLGFQQPVLN